MNDDKVITIKVLKDFSESPGPRYENQGPDSGEKFYHDLLNGSFAQALNEDCKLVLDLDGTDGYMSSFLDEAIGNLVYDFGADIVKNRLVIVSNEEPVWKDVVENQVIPEWAGQDKEPLKKSKKDHKEWYRLVKGELKKNIWIRSTR